MEIASREQEHWQRVCTILDQVFDAPATERQQVLSAACGGDRLLLEEVDALLALEGTSEALLGDSVLHVALLDVPAIDHPSGSARSLLSEQRVGLYTILGPAGPPGGMGQVYRASRADSDAVYALKVMHPFLDTAVFVRLFHRERRLLSRLQEHTGIARFLDAGTLEDGRPYVVMDYVEGIRIDHYCDEHRLGIAERLHLFLKVCDAISYAHSQFVAHRDLKPGNILVTESGSVRVVDFGIATLLSGTTVAVDGSDLEAGQPLSLDETDRLTATNRFLTWAYASPEQVRGEATTVATDIYALGVVLYELLTGRHPYDLADAEFRDRVRIIEETVPELPSKSAPTIQSRSEHSVRALSGRLRGDLDAIVRKALEKRPADRYASIEQFAGDLRAHLEHRPVSVRNQARAYRLTRFMRRNWTWLAPVTALVVALAIALPVSIRQTEIARREASRAEAVKDFLVEMFEASDPRQGAPHDITARQILDRGAERLEAGLDDEPQLRAELLGTVGEIYRVLGLFDAARKYLDDALLLRQEIFGPIHADVAESIAEKAELLQDEGLYPAAESLHVQALTLRRRLLGPNSIEVASSLESLADLRAAQGRYQEAAVSYRQALHLLQRIGEEKPYARTLADLALALFYQGEYDEADSLFRASLAIQERLVPEEDLGIASTLNNLGHLKLKQGDLPEASRLFERSLTIRKRLLGDDHPSVATSLNNLAAVWHESGEYDRAADLFAEVLSIRRSYLGAAHPNVATTLNNLASAREKQGRLREAGRLYWEALDMRRKLLGDHPQVAASLDNLAGFLKSQDSLDAAEPLYREALRMYTELLGADNIETAQTMSNYASLLSEKQQWDEARELYRNALAIEREVVGEEHFLTNATRVGLGYVETRSGGYEEAERLLRDAVAILTRTRGDTFWLTAVAQSHLGACLRRQNELEEAERLLLQGYATLESHPDQHRQRTRTRRELYALYQDLNEPAKARSYAEDDTSSR